MLARAQCCPWSEDKAQAYTALSYYAHVASGALEKEIYLHVPYFSSPIVICLDDAAVVAVVTTV